MPKRRSQSRSWSLGRTGYIRGGSWKVNKGDILVAKANHLFCLFLATPSSSDCSDAATDPQGYSAPTPMPSRNLEVRYSVFESVIRRVNGS